MQQSSRMLLAVSSSPLSSSFAPAGRYKLHRVKVLACGPIRNRRAADQKGSRPLGSMEDSRPKAVLRLFRLDSPSRPTLYSVPADRKPPGS
jgi:hypothetical protein